MTDHASLIYDWNTAGTPLARPRALALDDETLRDGLQGPSVATPSIEEKLKILHLMDGLGIDTADVGLPGAGPHVVRDVERLVREIADARLRVTPNCAARTVEADIRPVAEVAQRTGVSIECCTFIGSSPIRQYAEDWTLEYMLRCTEEAVMFAVRQGLPVMYVTEDTTRAHPDTLRQLYSTAIRCGARRVCISDTVGHATPEGARALVGFVQTIVSECGGEVGIDWHGHQDRGLGIINTLAAAAAGATRVHGCALGIGERVGNTPMDLLLVNLTLLGWIDRDLSGLREYCATVARCCAVVIPPSYPVFGRDAFRTATGVHAAAVIKAYRKGDVELANSVYSGVPAHLFGREQEIDVGPMSGRSNVVFWLERHGVPPDDRLVDRIFALAKGSRHVLEEAEILAEVERVRAGTSA